MKMNKYRTGVVKWTNSGRNSGFIAPDDDGADVYISWGMLSGNNGLGILKVGDRVKFKSELIPGNKNSYRVTEISLID
jgi:CspA family cold shock protein